MVIRMRHTRAHTGNRRSHHALADIKTVTDKETGSVHLRHRVDMKTGVYKGKKVIDVLKKVEKKIAKKRKE